MFQLSQPEETAEPEAHQRRGVVQVERQGAQPEVAELSQTGNQRDQRQEEDLEESRVSFINHYRVIARLRV